MPTRLCSVARCPNPATYRGRCATHSRQNERTTHQNKALYNTVKWKHTRKRVLFDAPLCSCGAVATDVHHKVDVSKGGDPWDRANLEPLCHPCHSRITKDRQST